MLTDFIEKALAQIDDLAELKVTLVALRLLDAKQSATASVTEREVLAHAAVQSLSFPDITLKLALQKATARGTLIEARLGNSLRYFANSDPSRNLIEVIEAAHLAGVQTTPHRFGDAVRREFERLELVEAYEFSDSEQALLREWQARGYTPDEVAAAARPVLQDPRPGHAPARRLKAIEKGLTAQPPRNPSNYFQTLFADKPPLEPVTMFKALARRAPNGHEFELIEAAITLFGLPLVRDGLKRIAQGRHLEIDELLPLLAEQEEAQLVFERSRAQVDINVKALLNLYESMVGLPPTDYIAQDIKSVYERDVQDVATWRAVFEYAAQQNKKDWRYIRSLLLNPSPNIFMPQPANVTAQFAFNEYKRRVGRLDPSVANEMNTVAQTVPDEIRWRAAFDAAANANALNWNYIKKVLTSEGRNDKVEPVNEAAQWAFTAYRARIGRLDKVVAEGINEAALKATEPALWERAFDESAKAGVLKWVYIQKVIEKLAREAAGGRPTRKRISQYGTKGRKRRQVDYTDAEREAAEERARQQLAEKPKPNGD